MKKNLASEVVVMLALCLIASVGCVREIKKDLHQESRGGSLKIAGSLKYVSVENHVFVQAEIPEQILNGEKSIQIKKLVDTISNKSPSSIRKVKPAGFATTDWIRFKYQNGEAYIQCYGSSFFIENRNEWLEFSSVPINSLVWGWIENGNLYCKITKSPMIDHLPKLEMNIN